MSSTSDQNQTREKFRQQMGTIFLKYSPVVLQAALRTTGNPDNARDILQNVFTGLVQRRSLPRDFFKNPQGYLYRSAVNAAINFLKAHESQKLTGESIDTLELPAPEHDWDREYDYERIREAMNVIRPDFIEILTLYHIEGYSSLEIAKIRTKRVGAVVKELWRARKALKKAIRLQEKQRETQKEKHQRDRRQTRTEISEA